MRLTPTQRLYLELLQANPDGVARDTLFATKAPPTKRDSNIVDVHIKNLRACGYKIKTLRGIGFKLL
jgi:DNA-binding response OmpR family regulator